MSNDQNGKKPTNPPLPIQTPTLTPATMEVIDQAKVANSSMSVLLMPGTHAGKGQVQAPDIHIGVQLSPGTNQSQVPTSAPVNTDPLSNIEHILTTTDGRIQTLANVVYTVFNDENRLKKEKQDKQNLRIAATSLQLSLRSLRVAVRSLWIVAGIGVAGVLVAWWYGYWTAVSGDASDIRTTKQAEDQLAATQKLVDRQADEIVVLKQQLAVMQHLQASTSSGMTSPPNASHVGRNGVHGHPGKS